MALANATIWFDLHQILGGDFQDVGRVHAYVVTNVDTNTLTDTSTGEQRLGDQVVAVASDGTGSWTTWVPGPEGNPASWQETLVVKYPRAGQWSRKDRRFGPYTIAHTLRNVTNKALTSNVATLGLDEQHGLRVGDSITVSNVDATFNGNHVITVVPSPTQLSYAVTAANVASTAATGEVGSPYVSLALLEEEQAVPPEYITTVTDLLDAYELALEGELTAHEVVLEGDLTAHAAGLEPTLDAYVTAAEVAKVAAELAETNAELAETNAETARFGAEAAEASAQALVLSDLGTTDGQTSALLGNPASLTAIAAAKTSPLTVNVSNYGIAPANAEAVNNAGMAALFGDHTSGVILAFPEDGTYNFSAPLPEQDNVGLTGVGLGTVAKWTSGDMLAPVGTVSGFKLRDISAETASGAGHLFNLGATGGLIYASFVDAQIRARDTAKSIVHLNGSGNFFGNVFDNVKMWRQPTHTVPAFNIIGTGGGINTNRWRGGLWHSQECDTTPFFRVEITTAGVYAAKFSFEDIIGERNMGGMIHMFSANGTEIVRVVDHDALGDYQDHIFKFSATSGSDSRGVTFRGSGSSGVATFAAGKYHLMIDGSGGSHDIGRVLNGGSQGTHSLPSSGRTVRHGGALATSIRTVTIDTALAAGDSVLISNGPSRTHTLPDPTALLSSGTIPAGREYTIKNIHATSLTVDADGAATIDGVATTALATNDVGRFVTDGTNWSVSGLSKPDALVSPPGKVKAAGTTRNNDAVFSNDPDLSGIAVVAGGVYKIDAGLIIDSSATADFKMNIVTPGGSVTHYTANGFTTSATAGAISASILRSRVASSVAVGGVNAGTDIVALPQGCLVAGADGVVDLQWAQNTAEVSDTKLKTGSWLILTRVA